MPFFVAAIGMDWVTQNLTNRRLTLRKLQQISGILLVILGIGLATGLFKQLVGWFMRMRNG